MSGRVVAAKRPEALSETLLRARDRALLHLLPPPKLKLSDWIERTIQLPEGSALPGPVRLWQFQREIADAIGDDEHERVTLVKPVRVGFTSLLTSAIAAFASNDPSPILLVLPTEQDCRDAVVSDIEPVFAATPALRTLLTDDIAEGERNTLLSRRFPGGSLRVVAARAPRNLRRMTIRVLMCDEADALEITAEGNPISLAERRTLSYANRKIVTGSTPLLESTSNVIRSYAASDMRIFEVPCPECGGWTEILWRHIRWPEGRPEESYFACPHCGCAVDERHKGAMVEAGRWRKTAPDVKGHAGFKLNALVSPLHNASWAKLAAEFLQARHDTAELQAFTNTILAEPWREAADALDETELSARAEPFGLPDRIPPECVQVTCGCDVQDDRFEVTVCGWDARGTALVLAHIVLWGRTDDDSMWAELDELFKTRWKHPSGGMLRIDAAACDAGDGQHFDRVLNFCGPRLNRRIVATKGVAGTHPAIKASQTTRATGKNRLFLIGVDGVKGQILTKLSRGNTIRFSDTLDAAYFEQLASERRIVRYSRGVPVRRFERIPGRRAEALDCLCYAMAVRNLAPLNLEARLAELSLKASATPLPTVTRSSWVQNRGGRF